MQINKHAILPACIMSIGGLITFFSYHYFAWTEGSWAVITVAAITQANVSQTFNKTLLRLIGTMLGATAAVLTLRYTSESIILPSLFVTLFLCTLTTLCFTQYRYAMIITGLTFTLVLSSQLLHDVEQVAYIRSFEVGFGCIVGAVVSSIMSVLYPSLKGDPRASPFRFVFHKKFILEAFLISTACAITFITWRIFKYPLGFWATISCLFVLEENIGRTVQNSFKRFSAHFIVVLFTGLVALVIPSHSLFRLYEDISGSVSLWLLKISLEIHPYEQRRTI